MQYLNAFVEYLSSQVSGLLINTNTVISLQVWQSVQIWLKAREQRKVFFIALNAHAKRNFEKSLQYVADIHGILLGENVICLDLAKLSCLLEKAPASFLKSAAFFCHLESEELCSEAFGCLRLLVGEHSLAMTYISSCLSQVKALARITKAQEIFIGTGERLKRVRASNLAAFVVPRIEIPIALAATETLSALIEKCAHHVQGVDRLSAVYSDSPLLSEQLAQAMRKQETHVLVSYALPLLDAQSAQKFHKSSHNLCLHTFKPECGLWASKLVDTCLWLDPQPGARREARVTMCTKVSGSAAMVATHPDALLASQVHDANTDASRQASNLPWAGVTLYIINKIRLNPEFNVEDAWNLLNQFPEIGFSRKDVEDIFTHLITSGWLLTLDECGYAWSPRLEQLFASLPDPRDFLNVLSDGTEYLAVFPHRTAIAYLPKEMVENEFCKVITLYEKKYQRLAVFHPIAEVTYRPTDAPSSWLGQGDTIFNAEQALQAAKILASDNNDTKNVAKSGLQWMQELRKRSNNVRRFFPYCLEESQNATQWWTFAGASINAALGKLLQTFLPHAQIAIGNFSIQIQETDFKADSIHQFIHTFKNPEQWKMPDIVNAARIIPELDTNYLFYPLLPPNIAQSLQNRRLLLAQNYIHNLPEKLPIIPTSSLVQLSEDFTKKTGDSASNIQVGVSVEKPKPKKPFIPPGVSQKTHNFCGLSGCGIHTIQNIGNRMVTHLPWFFIDQSKDFFAAINILLKKSYVGLDVETTLYKQSLSLIQMAYDEATFLIDPLALDIRPLMQILENQNIIKVIHNASFEKSVFKRNNIEIYNVMDTLTVSRRIHGKDAPGKHSLKAVCLREFGREMDKTCQTSNWQTRPLSASQLEYAALDAEILVHLYKKYSTMPQACIR